MASLKRLKSVCHSIGHHATSGLSFVNPHLSRACKAIGLESAEINLLDVEPYPKNVEKTEPLRKALLSLKEKFEKILNAEGFAVHDLESVKLQFRFPSKYKDDYCCDCYVFLIHKSGKAFSRGVNYVGEIISSNQ
jgi:hypothetical protein